MSDDNVTTPAPEASVPTPAPVPAVEAAALALSKALSDDVAKLKKDVKRQWIVTIVLIVLVVLLGASSLVPRFLLGGRMGGGAGFRPGMNGQQFQGGPGGAQPGAPGGNDDHAQPGQP
ncbi:MAG: hypothetical protein Q7W30_04945 [Coriobacteriia bacterium]|nr:hypothetical protein [Coriobacteriia bacterium]